MTIKGDTFILTKAENAFIRRLKDTCETLPEYIEKMTDYMKTRGLEITFDTYPVSPTICSQTKRLVWQGRIKGSIKNHKSRTEIYGSELWNNWSSQPDTQEKLLEHNHRGGGGGGNNFSYDSTFGIYCSMLTKLKDKIFIKESQDALQKKFDSEISDFIGVFKNNKDNYYEELLVNNPDYQEIQATRKILEELQKKLANDKFQIEARASELSKIRATEELGTLPEVVDGFIDSSNLLSFKNSLAKPEECSKELEQLVIESLKEVQEFKESHPEYFI